MDVMMYEPETILADLESARVACEAFGKSRWVQTLNAVFNDEEKQKYVVEFIDPAIQAQLEDLNLALVIYHRDLWATYQDDLGMPDYGNDAVWLMFEKDHPKAIAIDIDSIANFDPELVTKTLSYAISRQMVIAAMVFDGDLDIFEGTIYFQDRSITMDDLVAEMAGKIEKLNTNPDVDDGDSFFTVAQEYPFIMSVEARAFLNMRDIHGVVLDGVQGELVAAHNQYVQTEFAKANQGLVVTVPMYGVEDGTLVSEALATLKERYSL